MWGVGFSVFWRTLSGIVKDTSLMGVIKSAAFQKIITHTL